MLMRHFWFASSVVFGLFYLYILIGTLCGFVAPSETTQAIGCYFIIVYWLKEAVRVWKEGLR